MFGPVIFTTLLTVVTGCGDPVFEPFENNSREFSIFGFLDASADTQ